MTRSSITAIRRADSVMSAVSRYFNPDEYVGFGFLTGDPDEPASAFNFVHLHEHHIALWPRRQTAVEALERLASIACWEGTKLQLCLLPLLKRSRIGEAGAVREGRQIEISPKAVLRKAPKRQGQRVPARRRAGSREKAICAPRPFEGLEVAHATEDDFSHAAALAPGIEAERLFVPLSGAPVSRGYSRLRSGREPGRHFPQPLFLVPANEACNS